MATYKFLLWHVPVTMVVNVRVDASKAMINLMTMLIAVQRGTDLQFASRNTDNYPSFHLICHRNNISTSSQNSHI